MSGTYASNVTNLALLLRARATSMTQLTTDRLDDVDVVVVIYTTVGFLVGVGYFFATSDIKGAVNAMVTQIGCICLIRATLAFFWHVILGRN